MHSRVNGRTPKTSRLPKYDYSLSAYQRAFASELRQSVELLPIGKSMRILDVPCGNGFYTRVFADLLGRGGKVDAVDRCPIYIERTRRRLQNARGAHDVQLADAMRLPFAEGTFDLVWCAQSLVSLPDPGAALQEMRRVLRRGGILAVLENDIFHHVLLPWPIDLEVAVCKAIQESCLQRYGSKTKFAPVRRLAELLADAGFHSCRKQTIVADRQAPWPASVQTFLGYHVKDLRRLIGNHLSPTVRKRYQHFVASRDRHALFGKRPKDLTCLNVLYEATK
jgi:ubiquinone/menaquinone biosynthesis C-methylase UbiE